MPVPAASYLKKQPNLVVNMEMNSHFLDYLTAKSSLDVCHVLKEQ